MRGGRSYTPGHYKNWTVTVHWADRHFAEGLGFWEVNVYKALQYFHPSAEYKTLAVTATSANSSHTPFLLCGVVRVCVSPRIGTQVDR